MLRSVISSPKIFLATVFLALSLLGAGAWATVTALDYGDTLDRARQDVRQAAALLDGHAQAVLERSAMALGRIADRMDGGGPAGWAGHGLGEALAVAQSATLAVLDSDGEMRFGVGIAFDGDGLRAMTAPAPDEAVGALRVATGSVAGERSLLLGRVIRGEDGGSDGTAVIAVPVGTLWPVLAAFGDGLQRSVGLFGLDGERLVGFGIPSLGTPPRLDPGAAWIEDAWTAGVRPGSPPGLPSILGLKRMQRLPVLAAVVVPRSAVLAPWSARLERGMVVMLVGVAALAGLSLLGLGSLRREGRARRALTEANAGLEQRVQERTAALSTLNQKLSRALDEKERANLVKGRFLSAANHDLRQPFQALRLFHHILMERLSEPRDRTIAEKMGEALDAGEKLLHAMLEVATLDAGVVQPQLADVPVSALLDEVLEEFRGPAAEKGLSLRAMPCRMVIRSDRALLGRMLRDLLRNAVRFTERGRITIGCRRRGNALRIEVWDTGAGIPADQFDNVFEDFVQLGNPARDRRQGLGLGLARVRRKAALLGHALELRSVPGRGSVFAVAVPVVGAEAPWAAGGAAAVAAGAGRPAAANGDARLILVVEDDPVQRDGMCLLLESWGHGVVAAEDGEAALARLDAGSPDAPLRPDLVVSDFRLPGALNGVQAVARVGERLGRPVPGIILTGDTAPERLREAGATGCRLLHKPVTPERLREAITAVIGGAGGGGAASGGACDRSGAHGHGHAGHGHPGHGHSGDWGHAGGHRLDRPLEAQGAA